MVKHLLLLGAVLTAHAQFTVSPGVAFPQSNTVYVVGSTLRAFTGATAPNRAKTNAVAGNWIVFGPGTYTVTNLLKAGVNYDARLAKLVVASGTVASHAAWDDRTSGPTTNTIYAGYIEWQDTEDDGTARAGIAVTVSEANSDIVFKCDRGYVLDANLSIATDVAFCTVSNGKLHYEIDDLDSDPSGHAQALYASGGTVTYKFGRVTMGHGRCIPTPASGVLNLSIRGNTLRSKTGGPPLLGDATSLSATNVIDVQDVHASDGQPLTINGGRNTVKLQSLTVDAGAPFFISGGQNTIEAARAISFGNSQGIGLISGGWNNLTVSEYRLTGWHLHAAAACHYRRHKFFQRRFYLRYECYWRPSDRITGNAAQWHDHPDLQFVRDRRH